MIFVSAGHYPSKPGASWERFVEHDEAMIWATNLAAQLAEIEINSLLVPTGILRTKVDFINNRLMNGDFALEIHFNAARDGDNQPVGKGSETLYYPESEKGKALAEVCQSAMTEFFLPDRGVKEGWYRMDKSKGADFFLAKTKCPAVILEPDFVHHSDMIEAFRDEAVVALAEALKEYKGELSGRND